MCRNYLLRVDLLQQLCPVKVPLSIYSIWFIGTQGNNISGLVLFGHDFTWATVPFFFFYRMKDLGMNTYLYAPKDDIKHRALWREQYDLEEAGTVYTVV